MRRKDREIKDINSIVDIIQKCDIVRIGLIDGDYAYIVPMNFGYEIKEDNIYLYIHGAMDGKKFNILNNNHKCSFEMDLSLGIELLEERKDVTMRYQSVMGKAEARLLDGAEKEKIVDEIIMARYECTKNYIYNKDMLGKTAVFELKVIKISGKQNI